MIPSPCIGICRIDPLRDLCVGCARTQDEIASWQMSSDEEKNAIWSLLPERCRQMKQSLRRLNWSVEDLRAFILTTLAPGGGTWVSGVNGAIAEFRVGEDELADIEQTEQKITACTRGGAIRLALNDHVTALAISRSTESIDHDEIILLTVSRILAQKVPETGLTRLGPDLEAIRLADRDASLYDFGLGRSAGAFCVRTNSPALISGLDEGLGTHWSQFLPLKGADILAESPVRVVRNAIGRIEVYNRIPPPGGESPSGPHTHFLPAFIQKGGDLPPSLEIPETYVPCAIYYPPAHSNSHAAHRNQSAKQTIAV